jgi:hypothetical protein
MGRIANGLGGLDYRWALRRRPHHGVAVCGRVSQPVLLAAGAALIGIAVFGKSADRRD